MKEPLSPLYLKCFPTTHKIKTSFTEVLKIDAKIAGANLFMLRKPHGASIAYLFAYSPLNILHLVTETPRLHIHQGKKR